MKTLKELYQTMVTIRLLEGRLQDMCDRGEAGDLHFNRGQEAISVGVCAALSPDDHMVTHHRTIAHQIAKGAELYPLIAEVIGKRTGTNGGRAGEMHISNKKIRHDFSFQLVGTCIPVAAGLAWGLKHHHKKDEIVTIFFGDAATSNGQFHEGISLTVLHELPILLICENNHRAGNIGPEHYLPTPTVTGRMKGYGIESISVNGNDISEVIAAAKAGLECIRVTQRPYFIECNTERLCWHKQGQRDIRSAEELAQLEKGEPIRALEEKLGKEINPQETRAEVNAQLDEAFSRALADQPPEVTLD